MKRTFITAAIALSFIANAQELPKASPKAKVEQRIGLTDVTVEYHRPSVKDREIFGDVVPFNEIWRAGANEATLITLSDNVKINGKDLKAATYAIYFTPTDSIWKVHFNSKTDSWGTNDYDAKNDVLVLEINPTIVGPKVKQKPKQEPKNETGAGGPRKVMNEDKAKPRPMNPILKRSFVETMTFSFDNLTENSGELTMSWDLTKVVLKIEVDAHKKAMENIEKAIKESDKDNLWKVYRSGANYMLQSKKDNAKGLEWINKSIELNATNWYSHWVKAQLLQAEGKTKDAKNSADKAIKLGEEEAKAKKTTFNYKETIEKETANWN